MGERLDLDDYALEGNKGSSHLMNDLFVFLFSMEDQEVPSECALKVFKTTLNEFKTRDKYIKDDYRFKDRFSKLNPRKIIRMWAEKEKHNLKR